MSRPLAILLVLLTAAAALAAAPAGGNQPDGAAPPDGATATAPTPADPISADRARQRVPEDRYAMAGGCYAVTSALTGGAVIRTETGFAAPAEAGPAEPFRFQAFDLGKYLLFATGEDFLAAAPGPAEQVADATEPAAGRLPVGADTDLPRAIHGDAPDPGAPAPAPPTTTGTDVVAASAPSAAAEWVVVEDPAGGFRLHQAVDDGAEDDPGPVDPTIARTLTAAEDGTLTLADGEVTREAARFSLALVEGCAPWPEVEVNVDGPVATGDTSYEETRGFFDAHLHMMAFEFLGGRARCGRPWHPYGVTAALVDCPDHEPGGTGAVLEHVLSGTDPVTGHDTVGWPTFGYWPRYDSLTHEQVYYKWLERAWRGGLRMFTNLLVDNNVLCEVYPYKRNSCNEMDGVRLQAQRLRELERYIDAQWGGPGEGWFRIVTDPFEARRVINEGRLAVVMGIEVSALFDCVEYLGTPLCDLDQIDEELDAVYDLGVRQMELVNKFDNALSGVAGDGGETGVIVNQGNRYETGHYWQMDTCDEPDGHEHHAHDKTQYNFHDESGAPDGLTGRDALAGGILAVTGTSGQAPAYPEGPHCNQIGLTSLGAHLVERMMDKGMIFDPDHMSARARDEALDLIAEAGYSGVVSSHSWADDSSYRRIWELGGVVAPMSKSSGGFVEKWERQRSWADDRFLFGLGYGADTNGFASQGAPRNPDEAGDVDYPFTGFGGTTIDQQVSGEQVYDINTDGVDHYGLYPDWIEDLRVLAGDGIVEDMERGPEAYLQMWERAVGIPGNACRADVDDLTREDVQSLPRGATPRDVLAALGQPLARDGRTFTFCVSDGDRTTLSRVAFGDDRRLAGVEHTDTSAPVLGGRA